MSTTTVLLLFPHQNLRDINQQDLTLHLEIFEEHKENDFDEIDKAIQFEYTYRVNL